MPGGPDANNNVPKVDNSWTELNYLQKKAEALNESGFQGKEWDVASTRQAFEQAGLSAEEHFEQYGKDEGFWQGARPPQEQSGAFDDWEEMQQPSAPGSPDAVLGQSPYENILRQQYQELVGTAPATADIQYWTDQLTAGIMDFAQVRSQMQAGANTPGAVDWSQYYTPQGRNYVDVTGDTSRAEDLPEGWNAVDYLYQKMDDLNRIGFQGQGWGIGNTIEAFSEHGVDAAEHYLRWGHAEGFYKPVTPKPPASFGSGISSQQLRQPAPQQRAQLKAPTVDWQRDDSGEERRMSAKSRFKIDLRETFPVKI